MRELQFTLKKTRVLQLAMTYWNEHASQNGEEKRKK